jgi:hypothetical protein
VKSSGGAQPRQISNSQGSTPRESHACAYDSNAVPDAVPGNARQSRTITLCACHFVSCNRCLRHSFATTLGDSNEERERYTVRLSRYLRLPRGMLYAVDRFLAPRTRSFNYSTVLIRKFGPTLVRTPRMADSNKSARSHPRGLLGVYLLGTPSTSVGPIFRINTVSGRPVSVSGPCCSKKPGDATRSFRPTQLGCPAINIKMGHD